MGNYIDPQALAAAYKENASRVDLCPGCGDIALIKLVPQALSELGIQPHEACLVPGIGCSGQVATYMNGNIVKADHGRALPLAHGIKIANKHLRVIVLAGDGDTFSIGIEHFIHTARANPDIVIVVMDNQIYGLTKGQDSPTTHLGEIGTGDGALPVNPIALALASGASFVAQTFSGYQNETKEIIQKAVLHKGFSFINDFSPCVSFNKVNTYEWFREHCYHIEKELPHYRTDDKMAAYALAEARDRLALGIFYQAERPAQTDMLPETPMVDLPLTIDAAHILQYLK